MMGFFGNKTKKINGIEKLPKTVQETIPYKKIFNDGTVQNKDGYYTRAFKLNELNFSKESEERQLEIFSVFKEVLNTFSPETKFQFIIQNRNSKDTNFLDLKMRINGNGTTEDILKNEFNQIMLHRVKRGAKMLKQEKFLIIAYKHQNLQAALQNLDSTERALEMAVKKFGEASKLEKLTIEERLKTMFDFYNQDGTSVYYNDFDKDKKPFFNYAKIGNGGLTSKDIIGPSGFQFCSDYYKMGNKFGRALFLERLPTSLSVELLSSLADLQFPLNISMQYSPIDAHKGSKMVQNQLMAIQGQIANSQKSALKDGYSFDLLPPSLKRANAAIEELQDDISDRDQHLFYMTFVINVFADTKEELDRYTQDAQKCANSKLCPVRVLSFQQEQGMNVALPLCINHLSVKRLHTTESAAAFLPYSNIEIYQKTGIMYGVNKLSNNLLVYDRKTGDNFNGLFFGAPGSGKSMQAKQEMLAAFLSDERNVVYIIDPDQEYARIASQIKGGEVITIAPGSQSFLNPLDINFTNKDEIDPVAIKTDYVTSLVEMMLGKQDALNPTAKSVLTRCVKNIYNPYVEHVRKLKETNPEITCDKQSTPTLSTLYGELSRQPDPEARTLAKIIENYAVGGYDMFAHRSNVESDSKFLVYNVRNLGSNLKELGLFICLNDIWNKMMENYEKGLFTWIYIDEFHVLLKSDAAVDFLVQIWKRARKWNGIPTGIMQNTEDILRSEATRNIINNTSFITMMNSSQIDRSNLQELLSLSDSQLDAIKNAPSGSGLFKAKNSVIQFVNNIPKNTLLYKMINTDKKTG
jgi:hypothetical protein